MAQGLNKVMLLGNLGADPELRNTQSGESVMNFSLATTEKFKDRNGEKQERTEWHRLVLWGKRAEALQQFLRKGSRIFVEGSLRTTSYDNRDGNKRYKTEVVVSEILLQGDGKRTEPGNRKSDSKDDGWKTYDDAASEQSEFAADGIDPDDDIPF